MEQIENKFLDLFSKELRHHIVEFCKEISSVKADVFILLARKAACFIDVLSDINMVSLNGEVVSDRVLDMDTDWLINKDIVIIDDTIISGTSLKKNIDKLNAIGVKSIRVKVFCINDYWYVRPLLMKNKHDSYLEKPYLKLNHTASLRFCQNIVQLLSIFPRPYSTDFPVYASIRITDTDFSKLLFSNDWKVIDTTSELQHRNNVSTISLNPKRDIVKDFSNELGINFQGFSFLKVRLYAYKFPSTQRKSSNQNKNKRNKAFYMCRALPLALFNPVSKDYLLDIFKAICNVEKVNIDTLRMELKNNVAILRFVQYYIAHRFMLFSIGWMNNLFSSHVELIDPYKSLGFMFSPIFQDIVKGFKYSGILDIIEKKQSDNLLVKRPTTSTESKIINPLKIKEELLKVFTDFYVKEELPARRLVKKKELDAFKYEIINRLQRGVSFQDLKNILINDIKNNTDLNLIVSIFLDNAIDCGIVVPISVEDDDFLYRGYRHGEEVIWGINNDKLVAHFYKSIIDNQEKQTLSKFWFEKLLVLFVKMGLKAGILQEYNFNSPPPVNLRLIGIRSYLYGKITTHYEIKPRSKTNFNPILDHETKGSWYSNRLRDIEVIEEAKGRYIIDTERLLNHIPIEEKLPGEPEDLDDEFIDTSIEIAELLSIAKEHKLLNEDGLVQLTSNSFIDDNLSSIAAELYIFNDSIKTSIEKINSNLSTDAINVNFLYRLRKKSDLSWQSINSGQSKYLDFKDEKGQYLIKLISEELGKIDSFKQRSWKKYWKQTKNSSENDAPELYQLNDDIGKVLLEINIIYIFTHMLLYKALSISNKLEPQIIIFNDEKEKFEAELADTKAKIDSLNRVSTDSQTEIDFDKADILAKLRKKRKRISLDILSLKDKIKKLLMYWENNLDKIEYYHKRYIKYFDDNPNINMVYTKAKSYSKEKLGDVFYDIKTNNNLLLSYINTTETLLTEFSSLVPQWGKINKTFEYSTVIHINTSDKNKSVRKKIGIAVQKVLNEFEYHEFKNHKEQYKSIVLFRCNIEKEYVGYFIGAKGQFKNDRILRLASQLLLSITSVHSNFTISLYPNIPRNDTVKVYFNPSSGYFDLVSYDFTPYFENCEQHQINLGSGLFIYNNTNNNNEYYYTQLKNQITKFKLEQNKYEFKDSDGIIKELYKMTITEEIKLTNITVGIVTALPKEFAAMQLMLDEKEEIENLPVDDPNEYAIGYIKSKYQNKKTKIIITSLSDMGNSIAATATTNLLRSFPSVNHILLVGIAGGVPNPEKPDDHVRLGDIVYSDSLLQYDNIKEDEDKISIRSNSSRPSAVLIAKAKKLEADRLIGQFPWEEYIEINSEKMEHSNRPDSSTDICKVFGNEIEHPVDIYRRQDKPRIFSGKIGSAHTLLKKEEKRNFLRDNYGVKAIEMEGAGVADSTWNCSKGYFIVRGIVDYCNPDKSDIWQNYSAICAASYAKSLIELIY